MSWAGEWHPIRDGWEIAMATTAADVLIDALCDWGVEVIFGLPGDGINGLMEALQDTSRHGPLRARAA